jgi:FlaA1/EpsC-like NDP-sugar epimerase
MPTKTNDEKAIRVVIVGAGKAGSLLCEDIRQNKSSALQVVAFVDDADAKQGKTIAGVKVAGKIPEISKVMAEYDADEVLIALPSVRGEVIRRIVSADIDRRVNYRILPRISEVLAQEYKEDYLQYVRKVDSVDLVGGEINKADQADLRKNFKNQVVMVTGAAGSIGSELSRQVALYGAKKVVFYDWWENGMFHLRNELIEKYPNADFEFVIGDIKDKKKLHKVIKNFMPTTIFHAAAYKHVPLMEDNPAEAVKNNILGTKNVAEAAIRYGVKKFVLVSTDKAVNPTNVMGATKRGAEKVIHILAESQSTTTFCAVRFGNVANSNGSVLPFFEKQIERGGPVTVTHKDITRYFMSIPEAVHLILKAWILGENNDLFVLDMGEPIKIYELAKWVIAINGYIPEVDIKIDIIGLRPGEKLYEELLVDEEGTVSTTVDGIFKTKNYLNFNRLMFLNKLDFLIDSLEADDFSTEDIKNTLKVMVSTYVPSKH